VAGLSSRSVYNRLLLPQVADLRSKIDKMFAGVHINTTEDRAVLHVALRAPRDQVRPRSLTWLRRPLSLSPRFSLPPGSAFADH